MSALTTVVAATETAKGYLQDWKVSGRDKCLSHLSSLAAQPDTDEEIATILQRLVNELLNTDSPCISPEELADLYGELVNSLPSSSSLEGTKPAIQQIFIDAINIVDEQLEERTAYKEQLVKDKELKESGPPPKSTTKEKPKHRVIQERSPLVQLLVSLVRSGIVPQDDFAVNLEYGILHDAGFIRNSPDLNSKEIRARTKLVYRQTKVNLLREQSEGFSKFIIELSNAIGPPQDPISTTHRESKESLAERAEKTWNTLMKIDGYFDLDPTRMLDLTLDVFSTHLVTHYGFFLQLVGQFTAARKRLLADLYSTRKRKENIEITPDSDFDDVLQQAEGDIEYPPSSPELRNRLAQLLGFKLAFYESNHQPVPQSLLIVIALLIREGLFTVYDIYPHVSPTQEEMTSLGEKHRDEMRKRIRLAKTTSADKDNALANAPVLSEEMQSRRPVPAQPVPVKSTKPAPKAPQENNQHRDLAIALLSVGALRQGLFILTQHPWLIDRYPQIADILLRHLDYSIDPVYRQFSPSTTAVQPDAPPIDARKIRPTLIFPVPPATSSLEQVFFFPDWPERIPRCSSIDDLGTIGNHFLRLIGPHLYRYPVVFMKLCRIAHSEYQNELREDLKPFWSELIRTHLIPVISMSKDNALLGMELWSVIKLMDSSTRWSLYAEWMERTYESSPELRLKKALAARESKGVFRRLSSKNQGPSSRALAKIAHHNPCVLFSIGIDQVMSYDNLADPLVEALRGLTPIGLDILTFCLLDAFSRPDRPRMKDDGTNVAHWLQSLASFTAHLCRRYSSIDPTPILHFVVHRLSNASPFDSIILRELISKMSGIEPIQALSDTEISAMGGGPILQIETVASESRGALQTKPLQRSTDKLLTSLSDADLALPLLLLLAQQCQQCVYRVNVSEAVLKGLGSMADDLQAIFLQYLTFLSIPPATQRSASAKIRSDFFTKLPSISEIVRDYGLDPMTVLHMIRAPMQRMIVEQAVTDHKQSKPQATAGETTTEAETRLRAAVAAARENNGEDVEMKAESSNPQIPWLPILQPWIESVAEVLPPDIISLMGAPFFVTFWQLSLFEVTPLVGHYKEAKAKITKLAEEHGREERNTRMSNRERMAWQDKKDRLESIKENLVKESSDHFIIYTATKKRLALERVHWFSAVSDTSSVKSQELAKHIIQYCLFPRALLSPMDADFSSHFIKILHSLGTPGFSTLRCYDGLFGEQNAAIVFSSTQNEARNYGRFLRGVLRDLGAWSSDQKLWESDNNKTNVLPGFIYKKALLSWESYKVLVKKFHTKLCSALTRCISTGEFMHVSNAIIVLKEVLAVFPDNNIQTSTGNFLDEALKSLLSKETRGDLKVLATSYQGQLRKKITPAETPSVQTAPVAGSAPKQNGTTSASVGAGNATNSSTPSSLPSLPRNAIRPTTLLPPTNHPLPANPLKESQTEYKPLSVERPQIIKRIDRDAKRVDEEPRQTEQSSQVNTDKSTLKVPSFETLHNSSSRTPSGLPVAGQKDTAVTSGLRSLPTGPRKDASPRGHRLSEDPNSRPPPSAAMPPPKNPSSTTASQEIRAGTNSRQSGDSRRPETSRGYEESGRRSVSPPRSKRSGSADSDSRRREDERRSTRDDHRRSDRRSGREDDRERDRDKERYRERDRDRESSRRDRDRDLQSSRVPSVATRDDPNHTPPSPRLEDNVAGRKRLRDPREEDPSDRNSKRPARDRDRGDRDTRRDRTRDKDKDHRNHKRSHRDENVSPSSPMETTDTAPNPPSGPRAMTMIGPDSEKRVSSNVAGSTVTNAALPVREKQRRPSESGGRDRPSSPPRQSGNAQPSSTSASRTASARTDRADASGNLGRRDSYVPGRTDSSGSLMDRIEPNLPPRQSDSYRNGEGSTRDRSDREARKRSASDRAPDETTNSSTSKRVKLDRSSTKVSAIIQATRDSAQDSRNRSRRD